MLLLGSHSLSNLAAKFDRDSFYKTDRMKFEDWIVGECYDVMTGSTPYSLGRLVQKYQVDQIVALDFRKDSGEEYLYLVDETDTYLIHREPGEGQDTSNTVAPLTSDGQG